MFSTLLNIAVLATAISARACPAAPASASKSAASPKVSAIAAAASSTPALAQGGPGIISKSLLPASSRLTASAAASVVAATPSFKSATLPLAGSKAQGSGKYPFDNIVAYGDELSDNGNGSFAHGLTGHNEKTGEPDLVYGFGTWTNGPVAVSYLNDLLGLGSEGLNDYAFGGCCGGGSFGATLDNIYTPSDGGADSLVDQIANYTGHGRNANIKSSLQFIWIGENDVSKHTNAFWLDWDGNKQFATEYSTRVTASVKKLLDAGAPYVFVANIYPKHIAPVTPKYLCGAPNNDCTKTWGQVISNANTALQTSLTQFGDKVIYYDSFGSISNLAANAASYGFTRPIGAICDGAGDEAWNDCVLQHNDDKYFWFNFVQPSTRVHQLIAVDMKKAIDAHFGL